MSGMCDDTHCLERDYLARLRPEHLDVSDMSGASGCRIFYLMTACEYDDLTRSYGNLYEQLPETQQGALQPQASTSPIACYHKRVPPVDWLYTCTCRQESVPPLQHLSPPLYQRHHNPVPMISLQGCRGTQDGTEEEIQDDGSWESQAVPRLGNSTSGLWYHHP